MNSILDNFATTAKSSLQAFEGFSTQAHANFEKLVELNLTASKAAVTESFGHAQNVLDAKDVQRFAGIQSGAFEGLIERSAAYAQHVQSIFASSGTEFTLAAEAQTVEMQKAFAGLMANAPAGTEAAMAAFADAFASGQKALESAQASAKKALEVAQSNFAAATTQTTDIVKKATKVAA